MRPIVALLLAAALLSSIGDADANSNSRVFAVPPADHYPRTLEPRAAMALSADPTLPSHRIVLPEPTDKERAQLRAKNVSAKAAGKPRARKASPMAIGYARALPAARRTIVLADLAWRVTPDGARVARIELQSPAAAALRVALTLPEAHPDLTLRMQGSAPGAEVFGPVPANAVAEASSRHGLYWTPILEGDRATLEFVAGPGASVEGIVLTLGPLSHLALAGKALAQLSPRDASDIGAAAPCNIDVACAAPSAAITQAANAVGKLVISDPTGTTYACTGTMLNDSSTTGTPLVFTGAHCVLDAYLASTANVYWFFRAQTCGNTTVPPYQLQTGGAMLLARSDDWDWALLRLKGATPAGVRFSAWRAEPIPEQAVATSVHHAQGDLAKWSQGTTQGYVVYDDGSSFAQVRWNQGITESGSSGGGLFTFFSNGGYYELRGGLFAGDSSCQTPSEPDVFSRLDNMLPVVRQYLTPGDPNPTGQAVAVEFYNRDLDHYFITIDADEINKLDTGVFRGWERTGVRFLAYSAPRAGTNPVCRFYMRPEVGDSHFYSGDPQECADTARKFAASWIYESPAVFFIALPDKATGACPAGTRPVWRFFNTRTTNHRYTPEVALRDTMRADPVTWLAEGYGRDAVIMCSRTTND